MVGVSWLDCYRLLKDVMQTVKTPYKDHQYN